MTDVQCAAGEPAVAINVRTYPGDTASESTAVRPLPGYYGERLSELMRLGEENDDYDAPTQRAMQEAVSILSYFRDKDVKGERVRVFLDVDGSFAIEQPIPAGQARSLTTIEISPEGHIGVESARKQTNGGWDVRVYEDADPSSAASLLALEQEIAL